MTIDTATWPARAVAHVDLDAVAANCRLLASRLAGGAQLCAVVKADGYGHGMAPTARAALAGGATSLAVVTVEEAEALAEALAGQEQRPPVLILAPVAPNDLPRAIACGAQLTVWNESQVKEVAAARVTAGTAAAICLHIKRDTGMGRYGARSDREALGAIEAAAAIDGLDPHAVWTHLATADEPDLGYTEQQLAAFANFVAQARELNPDLLAHAANSAATLRLPASHFDMVRCGIAIYGLDPLHEDAATHGLEPALSLRSRVAAVRDFDAGESAGYGRRFIARQPTRVATVPIGYGDGWRRILSGRAQVLIGGQRFPQAGTVSMDSITVDIGLDAPVAAGDPVTLIGRDGDEQIATETVARQAETINYEITCGLTPRTRRVHTGVGAPG